MTDKVSFLSGEKVYLRPVEESDLERCHAWINDPDIRRWVLSWRPWDLVGQRKWWENHNRSGSGPGNLHFAICLHDGDRHIGNTSIHQINWIHRSGSTGTLIGEKDCWGKGYATEAKRLLVHFAFEEMNLVRLDSNVVAGNEASIRHLLSAGYLLEGTRRKALYIRGQWEDDLLFGLLREDWRNR